MAVRRLARAATLAVLMSAVAAQAEPTTVVLQVENATCLLCGPIVQKALQRVPGVTAVDVTEFDEFSGVVATVEFDDAATSTEALIIATTDVGYPSHPVDLLQAATPPQPAPIARPWWRFW